MLLAEAFGCGSHASLTSAVAALCASRGCLAVVAQLPGRGAGVKWSWALRAGALWASSALPAVPACRAAATTLLASASLPLAELRGDLARPRRYEIAAALNRLGSLRVNRAAE